MNATLETKVVTSSAEVMSGAPVFAGTRVPAQSLLDYLAGGHTIEEFLDDFPTVKRTQAVEFLSELSTNSPIISHKQSPRRVGQQRKTASCSDLQKI
jgi:uncharacterized protein (DUF433 family)